MERSSSLVLPLITFSLPVTIILDTILWFIIHMGISKIGLIIPDRWFDKPLPKAINKHSIQMFVYTNIFFVPKYKKFLPDGGAWFKSGFAKKKLKEKNVTYYETFLRETRRAEWTHYLQIIPVPIFLLFNPINAFYILIIYALLANMPCVLVQKYNQIRFTNLLVKIHQRLDNIEVK